MARHHEAMDAAFAATVVALEDRLVRLALLLAGGGSDPEDIVAEAAARVLPHWRRGRVDSLGAYLHTAVVNEVRRRGRRKALDLRHRHRRGAHGQRPAPIDEQVAARTSIVAALDLLGGRQRQAVVLRYFADLSVAETARVMGTSTGTVKSQVARALEQLRRHLDDSDQAHEPGGRA